MKKLLYSTDRKVLSADRCCRTELSARWSTIQHAEAGNGLFASRNVMEKGVAGSFYEPLASKDLRRELMSEKKYGDRRMEATAESFWEVCDGAGEVMF